MLEVDSDHSKATTARILVVDDDVTSQQKMSMAVSALGYEVEAVNGGDLALEKLNEDSFDLVLLDIVMPRVNGFDVLKRMKASSELRDIPVIVISALESEMDSVVKAIELGAEDFLPKNFERVLLRARVNSCIEKKKRRDLEVEYLAQVTSLTNAAAVLEKGKFNPAFLGLEAVCAREDALGRLARVFSDMAQQVYERERKLLQQVRTLKGVLMLFLVGAVFGLSVPLTRMAAGLEAHPFGLALWIDFLVFAGCVIILFYRGRYPVYEPALFRFYVVWGIIGAIGEVFLFWVAMHLQAALISIVLVAEGFIVFSFAALFSLERPKTKRLIGLGAGFFGVFMLITMAESITGVGSWIWLLAALIVPASYAAEDIVVAAKLPDDADITAAVGFSSLITAIIIFPFALVFEDFVTLDMAFGKLEIVVLLLTGLSLGGSILLVRLISHTGAVFASQGGYVITFAGIGWSMLILNETLPLTAWIALGIMIVGLVLVEPREEPEAIPDVAEDES